MKKTSKLFLLGCLTQIGITMAIQDYWGKAEYLRRVDAGWLDISPAVGIGIALVSYWWGYKIAKGIDES